MGQVCMLMVTSKLDTLMGLKAVREHRRISYRTVARETGIPLQTVIGIAHNTIALYPEDALVALCAYLDCLLGELLAVTEVADDVVAEVRQKARVRQHQRVSLKTEITTP